MLLRSFIVGLFSAFAFLGAGASWGQDVSAHAASVPVAVERFFQRPAVLDAKLSPSGTKIALTTSRGGTRIGLLVLDLSGEGPKVQRAASFIDTDVTQFHWVGDGRLVFSVLDLQAGSGEDRRVAPGLYAVNPDGTGLRYLIRRQGRPSNGQTDERVLDWNHKLMWVPIAQEGVSPDEVVIGNMEIGNNEIKSITPLWLNVRTGRTRSMAVDAPDNTSGWMFDSKGQARVAIARAKGRTSLYWRSVGQEKWTLIAESDLLHPPFFPSAVDDAGNLYVSFNEGAEGYSVLSRFDFQKLAPHKPALVSTPGFDFRGNVLLERAGSQALGVRVNTDVESTLWFDEELKQTQKRVDTLLPGRVNRLSCRRCGAPDMVVLIRSFSDRDPGGLFVYEAATQRLRFVSKMLDDIDPSQMSTVDMHRIRARDGRDLPVWLTQPPGFKPGTPLPAVVLVHGGPWVRIGQWRWQPMEQFLASRGYLVISPEFRGSTGYGDAHYRAGWKQWGQTMQDDVADALLWAQKQGLASDKACIAGASYGGYSTLMGLIRHPTLYRCGVAWVAVTDPGLYLNGAWWLDDDISESGRRFVLPELVGEVEKDAAMLQANSPLAQAKKIQAPLLLAFGESDRRVPLVHGERLRAALIDAGKPPEWVSYPNEGHSWRQVSTQVDFARRMEKFLGQYLKSDAP